MVKNKTEHFSDPSSEGSAHITKSKQVNKGHKAENYTPKKRKT